jgi:hypothetical protein
MGKNIEPFDVRKQKWVQAFKVIRCFSENNYIDWCLGPYRKAHHQNTQQTFTSPVQLEYN